MSFTFGFNPFTGNLDIAGGDLETDPLSIHKDGSSTTTAAIPFAVGLSIPNNQNALFGSDLSEGSISIKTTTILGHPDLSYNAAVTTTTDGTSVTFNAGHSNLAGGTGGYIDFLPGRGNTSDGNGGFSRIRGGTGYGAGRSGGKVLLLPGAGNSGANYGYAAVDNGLGSPGHFTLTSSDTRFSLYINKNLEVDGTTWLDGALNVTGTTTIATSLTGLLEATAGVIGTATAGTDYVQTLSVASPILNTGTAANPVIDLDETASFTWSGTHLFNNNFTLADSSTGAGPYLNLGDNSMAAGYVSIQNDQFGTGNILIEPQGGFAGSIYAKELGATFEGNFFFGILNHLTYAEFGAALTNPVVTAAVSSDGLSVKKQSTSAAIRGLTVQAEYHNAGGGSMSNGINGFNAFAYDTSTTTANLIASTTGGGLRNRSVARHRGTGTVTKMSGGSFAAIQDASAGTTTTAVAVNIEAPSIGAASTVTSWIGANFEAAAISGTATNAYQIFVNELLHGTSRFEVWLAGASGIFLRESGNQISSPSKGVIQYDAATRHDFTQNIQITKATPSLTFTDSGGDDYLIDVGSTASLFRIRNSTDSRTDIAIDGSGNVAFSNNYSPLSYAKLYIQNRITDPATTQRDAFVTTLELIPTNDWTGGNMYGFDGGVTLNMNGYNFNNGSVIGAMIPNVTIIGTAAKTVQAAVGVFPTLLASGGGTITTYSSFNDYLSISAMTVTTLNHYLVRDPSLSSGGAVTTQYGIYLNQLSGGTANYEAWFNSAARAYFRSETQYMYSSASETLDDSAKTTRNFRINGTTEATLTSSGLSVTDLVEAASLRAKGDSGGSASTNTITSGTAGVGGAATTGAITAKGTGPTGTAQVGWIKVYVGTTASWIPYWQ